MSMFTYRLEAGPVTTPIGHHYEEGLELEVPTRPFVELHEVYRDAKRADRAKRRRERDGT